MDITKDNFDVSLSLVEDTIVRWADFCAIDLEFTGGEKPAILIYVFHLIYFEISGNLRK